MILSLQLPTHKASGVSLLNSTTPYQARVVGSSNISDMYTYTSNITHTLTDVVVQDGYQSVLNLRTVLKQIGARHPRIKRCYRESDGAGAYNSVFVALFTMQLGQGGLSGNIKVVEHGHNEGGHGSDICDTAGTVLLAYTISSV